MQQFFLIIDSSYLGVNGFVRSRSYTLWLHIPNDPGHFSEWQTTRPPNSREWSTILQADLMEDMRTKPSWWQWWLFLKGFERLQRICFVWEPQQYLASMFLQHRACTPDERLPIPRSSATAARASFEDNLAPNIAPDFRRYSRRWLRRGRSTLLQRKKYLWGFLWYERRLTHMSS